MTSAEMKKQDSCWRTHADGMLQDDFPGGSTEDV
jgi:hypothetical protein